MSRTKTFFIGSDEDIAEYYHSVISESVRVSVGVGFKEDGIFKFLQPQNFEVYEITGDLYDQLLESDEKTGKPQGTFRKPDLWKYIDIIRDNTSVEAVTLVRE